MLPRAEVERCINIIDLNIICYYGNCVSTRYNKYDVLLLLLCLRVDYRRLPLHTLWFNARCTRMYHLPLEIFIRGLQPQLGLNHGKVHITGV